MPGCDVNAGITASSIAYVTFLQVPSDHHQWALGAVLCLDRLAERGALLTARIGAPAS